jgi:MFS family permease
VAISGATVDEAVARSGVRPSVFDVVPFVPADPSALTSVEPEMLDRRQSRLIFVATAIGAFLVTANVSTMNVAFPDLARTFPLSSRGELTWVLNAYTISFAALLIPAGRLADRFGRRQMFMAGLGMFAASSVLVGVAPSFSLVIAARVAQGVAGALIAPSSLGLLLAGTDESARMATVAKWGAVTALGVATGPSIGAFIVDSMGWRWAFLLLPPFCLVAYVIGRGCLPRSATDRDAPLPDVLGATMLAGSMALLAFAIVQIRPWGWGSNGVMISVGASVGLFVLTLLRGRGHVAPALPTHLFALRSLSFANVATMLQAGGMSASMLVNILWLTEGWGYSITEAGLATAPLPIMVAFMAPVVGRLGSRYGVRVFAIPGSFAWALGLLLFAVFVTSEPNFLLLWLPASAIMAVGVATTFPIVSAAAVSEVGPADFAVAGAINQIGRQVGATVGVAALVTLVGDSGDLASFRQAWIYAAAMGPVSAIAVFFIAPSRRSTQQD